MDWTALAQVLSQAMPSVASALAPQQTAAGVNQEYGGVSHQRIGMETDQERMMAQLQNQMAMMGMAGAMGDQSMSMRMLDPYRLAQGDIGPQARNRIKERSQIGLSDAYNQAINQSMQHANRMGVPLSSMQQGMQANLMQPALTQSMQMRAGMEQEELTRQMGMRDQVQQNMMAMQNMPALQRLLQIRMAETSRGDFNSTQEAGQQNAWKWSMQGGIDPNTGLLSNWDNPDPTGIYPRQNWQSGSGWTDPGGVDPNIQFGPVGTPGARGYPPPDQRQGTWAPQPWKVNDGMGYNDPGMRYNRDY